MSQGQQSITDMSAQATKPAGGVGGSGRGGGRGLAGVAWFGTIPSARFNELTSFFFSLRNVRRADPPRHDLDMCFFGDGPCEGQGYVCFYTERDAEAACSSYPGSIMVGNQPRFPIHLRLSSIEDMLRACSEYEFKFVSDPSASAQSIGDAAAGDPRVGNGIHSDSDDEGGVVFWLRGLPFEAQDADVERFLKPVADKYYRVDVGKLRTGECSGNAFVELRSAADREALEELHNTFIPIAVHAALQPHERPKPRFVEVIRSSAAQREGQLRADRTANRGTVSQSRRARVPTAAPAAVQDSVHPRGAPPAPSRTEEGPQTHLAAPVQPPEQSPLQQQPTNQMSIYAMNSPDALPPQAPFRSLAPQHQPCVFVPNTSFTPPQQQQQQRMSGERSVSFGQPSQLDASVVSLSSNPHLFQHVHHHQPPLFTGQPQALMATQAAYSGVGQPAQPFMQHYSIPPPNHRGFHDKHGPTPSFRPVPQRPAAAQPKGPQGFAQPQQQQQQQPGSAYEPSSNPPSSPHS